MFGLYFETEQNLLLVREITYHSPQRQRQRFDQRGRCKNPFIFGELRKLEDIDDLEVITTFELLFADAFQVRYGDAGSRALAGYKQSKQVLGQDAS